MNRILLLLCILYASSTLAALGRFERIQLSSQQSSIGVVDMDAEAFSLHALGKHNYSIIAIFSSSDKSINCPMCGVVNDQFSIAAAHFRQFVNGGSKQPGQGYESPSFLENPVFLVNCDIQKCKDIAMKLQWREIPKIVYVAPRNVKKNDYELEEMPNLNEEPTAEKIASWISEKTNMPGYKITPPITNTVITYVSAIIGVYFFVTRIIPKMMETYKNPMLWFVLSLGAYAFAMAGTVFNSINKPQFNYKHPQNGQIFWIYPQARQQFIAEGYLMAGFLTLAAVLFTTLGGYVPSFKGAWLKRSVFSIILVSFFFVYQAIFKIFKMKYNYYPL